MEVEDTKNTKQKAYNNNRIHKLVGETKPILTNIEERGDLEAETLQFVTLPWPLISA